MKKLVSFALSAAMTLSSFAVSSSVFAADEVKTDAFNVVLEDTTITSGLITVKVPVSFDKDVKFTNASIKFGVNNYPNIVQKNKAAVKKIESALPAESGVTVTNDTENSSLVKLESADGKNYTVKKGQPVLYVTVELRDENGAQNFKTPAGTVFRLLIDDITVEDANKNTYTLSAGAKKESSSFICVTPDEANDNLSFKFGSEITTDSKSVKVPIIFDGEFGVLRTVIGATEGAKITGIEKVNEDIEVTGNAIVYTSMKLSTKFDNEVVAYATMELTDGVVTASPVYRFIDVTDNAKNTYPGVVDNGMVLNAIKGDIDLSGDVTIDDAVLMINEALAKQLEMDYIKGYYEENNKDIVETFGSDKLVELAHSVSEIDGDGESPTIDDATDTLRYALNKDLDETFTWDQLYN